MTDAIQTEVEETAPEATDSTSWNKDELSALALAGGSVVVWLLAIIAFGTAGLIIPALLLVFLTFAVLIVISRG